MQSEVTETAHKRSVTPEVIETQRHLEETKNELFSDTFQEYRQ